MKKYEIRLSNRLNFLLEAKALTDRIGYFKGCDLLFVHSLPTVFQQICFKEKILGYTQKIKGGGSKYIYNALPNINMVKKLFVLEQQHLKEKHCRLKNKKNHEYKYLERRLNFLIEAKALTDSVGIFSSRQLIKVHSIGRDFSVLCYKEKILGYAQKGKEYGSKYIYNYPPDITLVKKISAMMSKNYKQSIKVQNAIKESYIIKREVKNKTIDRRLKFLIEAK
jgi:hypothetical protein